MAWFRKKTAPPPRPPQVNAQGAKRWLNSKGELHSENGPAIVWPDGTKMWYQNGKRHREDGPAVEYPSGNCGWYLNGQRVPAFGKNPTNKKTAEKEPTPPPPNLQVTFKAEAAPKPLSEQALHNRQQIAKFLRQHEVIFHPADTAESTRLQQKLFELGFKWGNDTKQVAYLEESVQAGLVIKRGQIYYRSSSDTSPYLSCHIQHLLSDAAEFFMTDTDRIEQRMARLEKKMDRLLDYLMPKERVAPIVQAKTTAPLHAKRRMPG